MMVLKKNIIMFCFSLTVLTASSQNQRYIEDSIIAQKLITNKLKSLQTSGVVNYLYLFSDAGTITIVYETDKKISGIKSYYKGNRSSKFRNLKLSKEDKLNYSKCIDMASLDKAVNFSNCKDFVHSFNRIVFAVSANDHYFKGSFTSDCSGVLEENNMLCLFSIYKRLLL
jgi:hypothetical protein